MTPIVNQYIKLSLITFGLIISYMQPTLSASNANDVDSTWQWRLIKAEFGHSEIAITSNKQTIAEYNFDCNLSNTTPPDEEDIGPSIDKVDSKKLPGPVLIVVCPVGAHSVELNIINPNKNNIEPVYSITGSYIAFWELKAEQLWITYDRPCTPSQTDNCEIPFKQIKQVYPFK